MNSQMSLDAAKPRRASANGSGNATVLHPICTRDARGAARLGVTGTGKHRIVALCLRRFHLIR
jgi:hypothetical protein